MREIVEAPEAFEAWVAAQTPPPRRAAGSRRPSGKEIFRASACVGCHTIRGIAAGAIGPDLTHFGSRRTLGAGDLPNTPENVAAWLKNPPALKPGSRCRPSGCTDDQARRWTYLISLK